MKPDRVAQNVTDDEEDGIDPVALERSLHQMGKRAREEAFAAGLTVLVMRAGRLIKLYPDGREEDVGAISDTVLTDPE